MIAPITLRAARKNGVSRPSLPTRPNIITLKKKKTQRKRDRQLPSKMECITQEDIAHKGRNKDPHRTEHGHKHWPFSTQTPCY